MSDPSSSWTVERVLLWAVRGGLLLIPVVALLVGGYGPFDVRVNTPPGAGPLVFPNLFFSYIAWKNFAFRMIVEVVIGLWIGLAAIAPRYRPRLSPVTIAVSALLGIIAIADFAGVAPTRSIWSNFERMQGLMGLLYLYAFFLVASSTMDRKAWFWFFHVSLGVCVLVSYDAVREWSVPAPPAGQPDLFGGRVGGKFGSPVHLACYLLFHVFLAAFYGTRSKSPNVLVPYSLATLLFVVALIRTETRAGLLGVLVGLGVVTALLTLLSKNPRVREIALIGGASVGGGLGVVALLVLIAPDTAADLLGPRLSTSGQRVTLMLATWSTALQGFFERPILGWGQENFIYVFDKHYHPAFYDARGWMWNDRPHNVFFRWLVEGGALGFLAYVAVLVSAMRALWRRTADGLSLREKAILTGTFAGYLTFASAQPDELLSLLLFFALLAFIESLSAGDRPGIAARWRAPVATLPIFLALGAAGVWWTQTHVHGPNIRAGRLLLTVRANPWAIDAVLAEGSFLDLEAREHNLMSALELRKRKNMRSAVRIQLMQKALDEMEKALETEPGRVRTYYLLAHFLLDVKRDAEALAYLDKAALLAPKRPRIRFAIARAYYALGQLEEAQKQFRYARDMHPSGTYTPSVSFPTDAPPSAEVLERKREEARQRQEELRKRRN